MRVKKAGERLSVDERGMVEDAPQKLQVGDDAFDLGPGEGDTAFLDRRPIPGPWGHFSEVGIDPACNEFLGNSIRAVLAR